MILDSRLCVILIFRNITQIQENAIRIADKNMLKQMSAVSHEMITPIKCVIALTELIKAEQSQIET